LYRIEKLRTVDPERASKLFPNDYTRLARALSIIEMNGGNKIKPISQVRQIQDFRGIVLFADKVHLYERLDRRCEQMIEAGLVEEVVSLLTLARHLHHADGSKHSSSGADGSSSSVSEYEHLLTVLRRTIGYREVIDFIATMIKNSEKKAAANSSIARSIKVTADDFLQLVRNFKTSTRNYASYQYKWYRQPRLHADFAWLDVSNSVKLLNHTDRLEFLNLKVKYEQQRMAKQAAKQATTSNNDTNSKFYKHVYGKYYNSAPVISNNWSNNVDTTMPLEMQANNNSKAIEMLQVQIQDEIEKYAQQVRTIYDMPDATAFQNYAAHDARNEQIRQQSKNSLNTRQERRHYNRQVDQCEYMYPERESFSLLESRRTKTENSLNKLIAKLDESKIKVLLGK